MVNGPLGAPGKNGRVMDLISIFRAVFGLGVTLGLVGLAAYAARRWGVSGLLQIKPAGERRLAVLESLPLDPQHRLVLVRHDGEERLLLLGEGRLLDSRTGSGLPHA